MNKPNKNPRGKFVMLYHDMIESSAWESLNGNARALYIHIAARYNGKNNGRISFSAREAAQALNASKATAARTIKTLIDRGFITVAKRSGFNLKRGQDHATEYRLTEFACKRHRQTGQLQIQKLAARKKRFRKYFTVSPTRPVGLTHETEGDSDID